MNPGRGVNIPASIKARLRILALAWDTDFHDVLMRYANERLLWRIANSPAAECFVLKGATRLMIHGGPALRSTQDLDFLAQQRFTPRALAELFRTLCAERILAEGLVFDVASIRAAAIREDNRYGGVRVRIVALLERSRLTLQIDVGFGDALTLPAPMSQIETLLGHPAPRLRVYPLETVVAEKLQIILERGAANTRLKDDFDLHHLSRSQAFDGRLLAEAMEATLRRNRTPIPGGIPIGLTEDFAGDARRVLQWSRVARRLRSHRDHALAPAVARLRNFLLPPLAAIRTQQVFDRHWEPDGGWTPEHHDGASTVQEARASYGEWPLRRSA